MSEATEPLPAPLDPKGSAQAPERARVTDADTGARTSRSIKARDGAESDLFQDLNELSIRYAGCFSSQHDAVLARREASDLLREKVLVISRLARWWIAELTPAFTAVSHGGNVYASEPILWPDELWPKAHELWVEANGIAMLAQQFVQNRFFVSYGVVAI